MICVLYSKRDVQLQSPFVQIHTRLVANKSNEKVQLVSIELSYCSLLLHAIRRSLAEDRPAGGKVRRLSILLYEWSQVTGPCVWPVSPY